MEVTVVYVVNYFRMQLNFLSKEIEFSSERKCCYVRKKLVFILDIEIHGLLAMVTIGLSQIV